MHTINLIAASIQWPEIEYETTDNILCAVTGEHVSKGILRKNLLGKSFTNGDLLKAPLSDYIGLDAYIALTYKYERCSSWYCNGKEFKKINKIGVRNIVIANQYDDIWSGYVTTSYKKHGSLFTKLNRGNRIVWRFEMKDVNCSDYDLMMNLWERLNAEIRAGIGRMVLESLICPPFLIKRIGLDRWVSFEKWAKPYYQGSLYKFLCYLLPSQEELKKESQ